MDKEIWLLISSGNKNAYSQAYVFYYKRLFNYGRKLTGDTTLLEDAIQEVLMMLWTKREKLPSIHDPNTYLFSSFRYTIYKKIKSGVRQVMYADDPGTEMEFSAEHFIIGKETNDALQQQLLDAIGSLTNRQREAIFLRFYEGLSYEELSSVLGISVKATYKIMARALLQLKDKLSFSTTKMILLIISLLTGRGELT